MTDTRYTKTYVCSRCKEEQPSRDVLTVLKAVFTTMGAPSKTIRSRVIAWLCPKCLAADAFWNRPPYVDPLEYDEMMEAEAAKEAPGA